MAAMRLGSSPTWIILAILCVITRVLPDPAPASTRQGPCMKLTASCWARLRPDIEGGTAGRKARGAANHSHRGAPVGGKSRLPVVGATRARPSGTPSRVLASASFPPVVLCNCVGSGFVSRSACCSSSRSSRRRCTRCAMASTRSRASRRRPRRNRTPASSACSSAACTMRRRPPRSSSPWWRPAVCRPASTRTPGSRTPRSRTTAAARRLDAARNQLSPETGSTQYRFTRGDLQALPLGQDTPLNQVLLQSPGMAQDGNGELHLRGDHANLQYRIDGVLIPEAISGFGQILDTRVAQQINVITGALPAQYGYRTAGVVDIRTPRVEDGASGSLSLNAGSRGLREVAGDIAGGKEGWTWFFAGSALHSSLGIENPTPAPDALHDTTRQAKGFGYLSRVLDANSRLTLMLGATENRFQIPNVPGQTPAFTLAGARSVDSAVLDARQREALRFQVLTYQASPSQGFDYQLSLGHRYSDVHYTPDAVGDLVFNGIAADILRKNAANSLQGDASLQLDDRHTLRAGLFAQRERFSVANASTVFPADANGNQASTAPIAIQDDSGLKGRLFGVYLQDQWQVTPALTVNYGA